MTGALPHPAAARVEAPLARSLTELVLRPYLPHCRYVHTARLTRPAAPRLPTQGDPASWLRLDAECGIDASCYIESTGHFNAVELNITYNQMLYLCVAAALQQRALPAPAWSFDEFLHHQLPDVLIADYQARFRQPMRSHRYRGWVEVTAAIARPQRNLVLLKTRSGCSDGDRNGPDACEATVTIAMVHWPSA